MATIPELKRRIDQALGREPADLVIKDTRYLDIASGEIAEGDVAIGGEKIVGAGESYEGEVEIDGRGKVVSPGFVDAHVHVESTLVTPAEFDRCVLPRGTTTARTRSSTHPRPATTSTPATPCTRWPRTAAWATPCPPSASRSATASAKKSLTATPWWPSSSLN